MRIRTIKPEFWIDEKVGVWDAETRLAFIWMWCAADDYGRLRLSPALLRSGAFAYQDMKIDRAREILATVSRSSRVTLYEVQGEVYGQIVSWEKHQKVDKPGKFQNPAPDRGVPLDSRECRESLARVSICTGSGTGPEVDRDQDRKMDDPSDRLAPSPRKAKAPKHDTFRLDLESWEWINLGDDLRSAWTTDYPGIDVDAELRKARAWVRADPAKRRKSNWTKFVSGWFSRAQDKAGTQRIPAVDARATQLQAEKAWQALARVANCTSPDKLLMAIDMLPTRTLDALRQWGTDPAGTVQGIRGMSYQEQETIHRAFVAAWIASDVTDDDEEVSE